MGEFELAEPMRRQAMGSPDLLDGAESKTHRLGHRPGRPVGRFRRRLMEGFLDNLGDDRRPVQAAYPAAWFCRAANHRHHRS